MLFEGSSASQTPPADVWPAPPLKGRWPGWVEGTAPPPVDPRTTPLPEHVGLSIIKEMTVRTLSSRLGNRPGKGSVFLKRWKADFHDQLGLAAIQDRAIATPTSTASVPPPPVPHRPSALTEEALEDFNAIGRNKFDTGYQPAVVELAPEHQLHLKKVHPLLRGRQVGFVYHAGN